MAFNSETDTIHLEFEEEKDAAGVNVGDLAHFLYLFRSVYVAGVQASQGLELSTLSDADADALRGRVLSVLADAYRNQRLPSLGFQELSDDAELLFTRMKKESPMEIWAMGLITALVFAVIISGGELKAPFIKAKLPPLGRGIAELRRAIGMPQRPIKPQKKKTPSDDSGPSSGPSM